MSKTYKFLPEDFARLLNKIAGLKQKFRLLGWALGESTEQNLET